MKQTEIKMQAQNEVRMEKEEKKWERLTDFQAVCPQCSYLYSQDAWEIYICPKCGYEGERYFPSGKVVWEAYFKKSDEKKEEAE